MKHTIAILISLSASWCFAVTIPRASMRQISVSPLARGETAYVEATSETAYTGKAGKEFNAIRLRRQNISTAAASVGTAYAEMYVGGESGPLRVIDSSALRGYKLRTLDQSEYSVSAGPLFAYDPANGTYTMTTAGPTNTIIITAKDGTVIENVSFRTEFTGEGLMPGEFTANGSKYDGSVYTFECAFKGATSVIISEIAVKAMDKGEVKWINDTIETLFEIHDVLGRYNLSDLRRWVRDLYNGNRGEDWSKYKAYRPVRMDGQAVRFTEDNKFTMSISDASNLVLQASMKDALEINVRGGSTIPYTTFRITGIDVSSGTPGDPVFIDFTCDIGGFNTNNLGVAVCERLEDAVWLGLPAADFVVSNISVSGDFTSGTVTIPSGVKKDRRFFKLMYGNAASDTIDIIMHGRVVIKDILILKGTDSKFYQINVNGGTITATEVSL